MKDKTLDKPVLLFMEVLARLFVGSIVVVRFEEIGIHWIVDWLLIIGALFWAFIPTQLDTYYKERISN